MSRCLVIGASSQLGRVLCPALRRDFDVIEAANRRAQPGQRRIDLTDRDGLLRELEQAQPAWIVIAGAYCNVDGAEADAARCYAVNSDGPDTVARYAARTGARVVFYSTDSVFDGAAAWSREEDPPAPVNVYSDSKVRGEAAVRARLPQAHLILRTASLYGPDEARRNFVYRLLGEAQAGRPVPVPSDQWGTPTYVDDLAQATLTLMTLGATGTYHAAGPDFLDRATFARRICERFGLDASLVEAVPTSRLGQAARRPLRVRLDCSKLRAMGIAPFRGVEAGLALLHQLIGSYAHA